MTIRRKPAGKKKAKPKPARNEHLVGKLRADLKRRGIETEEAGRRAIAAATHMKNSPPDKES